MNFSDIDFFKNSIEVQEERKPPEGPPERVVVDNLTYWKGRCMHYRRKAEKLQTDVDYLESLYFRIGK